VNPVNFMVARPRLAAGVTAIAALTAAALLALAPGPAWAQTGTALPPSSASAPAASTPAAEASASEPRFDLSVQQAPAAQVFMQLGTGTRYNMLVAPEVSGQISITLKNTTLPEALESLRELYGYDYRIAGQRVFVYPNTVQTRLFRVNYLPGRRQGASDLRVSSGAIVPTANGQPATTPGAPATGNNTTAARADDSAHVRTTSDADFWREVQASLAALVGSQGGRGVVLNPAAGVIVVKATPNEQRQVEQYLRAVQVSIARQVMIEAKIVEVALSKDAQAGVNWSGFGHLLSGSSRMSATFGVAAPGTTLQTQGPLVSGDNSVLPATSLIAGAAGKGFYGLALQASNFAALINFLQTQGDVQVLSSPRIATLNNQKAVLKVGNDELFVTGVTTSTTTSGNNTVSTPTLTLQPFFSGIVLDVTPQIDEQGAVILHVHPSISSVTEKQKNIDLGSLGNYRLPLAASTVNETDSIVRVHDGQFVAIGGLMVQQTSDERSGVPGLSEVPMVGGLFRQTSHTNSKRELVILMKPTVIRDDGTWPDATPVAAAPATAAPAR
jgi:MSHA biogenesis protein MshL